MVGIVTNRDLRFETNLDPLIKAITDPRKRLVTVREGASVETPRPSPETPLERVLVIDDDFRSRGLITVKDIPQVHRASPPAKDSWDNCTLALQSGR